MDYSQEDLARMAVADEKLQPRSWSIGPITITLHSAEAVFHRDRWWVCCNYTATHSGTPLPLSMPHYIDVRERFIHPDGEHEATYTTIVAGQVVQHTYRYDIDPAACVLAAMKSLAISKQPH